MWAGAVGGGRWEVGKDLEGLTSSLPLHVDILCRITVRRYEDLRSVNAYPQVPYITSGAWGNLNFALKCIADGQNSSRRSRWCSTAPVNFNTRTVHATSSK